MTTQDAAPVADQPIRPTCFHWLKNDKDDYGFALKDGRYALYPADMKLYSAPPDSLAVAQALEEWESTFDCNSPREAYAEMKQAVLAHINTATAQALEAVKKIGRDLQLEPIPEWSQPFRDGYREGISEYVHRINAFALTSAAETRRQVKKRRAARKQAT